MLIHRKTPYSGTQQARSMIDVLVPPDPMMYEGVINGDYEEA